MLEPYKLIIIRLYPLVLKCKHIHEYNFMYIYMFYILHTLFIPLWVILQHICTYIHVHVFVNFASYKLYILYYWEKKRYTDTIARNNSLFFSCTCIILSCSIHRIKKTWSLGTECTSLYMYVTCIHWVEFMYTLCGVNMCTLCWVYVYAVWCTEELVKCGV